MIFTSSWDDGSSADLKLADILLEYKIKGTFYIPIQWKYRTMVDNDLKKISKKFEIGSHSFSHKNMTKLNSNNLSDELLKSKNALKKITKTKVKCFAYPFGKFNDRVASSVKKSGYIYARTSDEFQTHFPENPFNSGVSISVTNRPRRALLTYGLILSLKNNWVYYKWDSIAKELLMRCIKENGIFHLHGHSWEIEKEHSWDALRKFFDFVSKLDSIEFMTNQELASYHSDTI